MRIVFFVSASFFIIIIRCYYYRYRYRCCCYRYVVVVIVVVVGVSPYIIRYQCDFSDPTHSAGLGRQAALEAIDVLLEQLLFFLVFGIAKLINIFCIVF